MPITKTTKNANPSRMRQLKTYCARAPPYMVQAKFHTVAECEKSFVTIEPRRLRTLLEFGVWRWNSDPDACVVPSLQEAAGTVAFAFPPA